MSAVQERAEIDAAVDGRTLPSVFADLERRHPDARTMTWLAADGALTGATVREQRTAVRHASLGLQSLGLAPGEMGVILAGNRYEHAVADLAIIHARAASVTLYGTSAPEQVAWTVNHSGASVAVVETAEHLQRFLAVRDQLPGLRAIVAIDADPAGVPGVLSWADLLARGAAADEQDPAAFDDCWQQAAPDDLLSLIYTSGTTGTPKGVMYTHRAVLWTAEASRRQWGEARLTGGRLTSYLPLAHVSERFTSHWSMLWRNAHEDETATVTFCPSMDQLVPTMRAVRPTFFVGVPRVWEKFQTAVRTALSARDDAVRAAVEQATTARREDARLRTAGEPVPPAVTEVVEATEQVVVGIRAVLGLDECGTAVTTTAPATLDLEMFWAGLGLPLIEVWGMSELTGPAVAVRPDNLRLGTIGVPIPGVQTRIAADGELLVRSGGAMTGYFRDPERTAETLDADGWLHTGDVARADGDFLQLVDRKKELIITSSGKNVAPVQVESLLKSSPLIGQALVVGDGHSYLTALVVPDREMVTAAGLDADTLPAALVAAVREANSHLARIEQVKRIAVLTEEWTTESGELTGSQKMRRSVVQARYADQIVGLYADPPIGVEVAARRAPVGSAGERAPSD